MVKRLFLICVNIALLLSSTNAWARRIAVDEAHAIAERFYTSQLTTATRQGTQLHYVSPTTTRQADEEQVYAFAAEGNRGFVLGAADDRAHEILGYSLEGTFSYDNMPIQLQALLDGYSQQIKALDEQRILTDDSHYSATLQKGPIGKGVKPLLGDIEWNQDAPFNRLCPKDEAGNPMPVGCVATAAAQIMKFHRYPEKGIGSRSYSTESMGIALSVNFAEATYDWANMLDSYNGTYTDKQAEAVAQLSYHVGVACRMDYVPYGSGATAKDIANALKRNFGYDDDMEYIDRTYFNEADWEAMLRAELDEGRPILHFGEGVEGGHAFVCDGYDAFGMFHYNWGWGGMSDGYYQSAALNPEVLGIGSGMGGYNYLQSALTQIQPPTDNSTHVAHLHLNKAIIPGAAVVMSGVETKVTASFYNCGLRSFTGEVSAALYNTSDSLCAILSTKQLKSLTELTGGTQGATFKFTIPTELADGSYRLYLIHKEEGTTEYIKMNAPVNMPNYLSVKVGPKGTTFTEPAHSSKLSLTAKPQVLTPLYNGRKASFSLTVKNEGEEFYSYLGILMQKQTSDETLVRQYVGVILTRIPKGATRTFTYSTDNIEVEAGKYDIVAVCDSTNSNASYLTPIGPDELMVTETTVNAKPIFPGMFQLNGAVTVTAQDGSDVIHPNDIFTVTAPITNKGDYDDGELAAIFFNRAEQMVGNSAVSALSLGRNETKELKITHRLNAPIGQYAVIIASVTGDQATELQPYEYNAMSFWLRTPSDIGSLNDDGIMVATQGNDLYVGSTTPMNMIEVYDTEGRTVSAIAPQTAKATIDTAAWPDGAYIVSVTTAEGTATRKIWIRR